MPVKMALWRFDGDKSIPVPSSSLDTEKRLEDILENDIGILGLGPLLVVGRQVPTRFGKFIDLLALGPDGDVYVIELKRDRTAREVAAQALDYGSWVRELTYDDFTELFAAYSGGKDFDDAQQEAFDELPESLNGGHHLVIVASELDPSTERILDYLNDFEVPINVVFFRYLKDEGNEYLARSWLVDPDHVETRTAKKKPPWNERDFYVAFGEGEHGAHPNHSSHTSFDPTGICYRRQDRESSGDQHFYDMTAWSDVLESGHDPDLCMDLSSSLLSPIRSLCLGLRLVSNSPPNRLDSIRGMQPLSMPLAPCFLVSASVYVLLDVGEGDHERFGEAG